MLGSCESQWLFPRFFLPRPEKIIIFAETTKNNHLPAPSASCYVVLQQVLPHVGILFLQTGTKLHHNWHWHSSATHRSTMQPDIWMGPGINVWGGSWDIDKHTGLRLVASRDGWGSDLRVIVVCLTTDIITRSCRDHSKYSKYSYRFQDSEEEVSTLGG